MLKWPRREELKPETGSHDQGALNKDAFDKDTPKFTNAHGPQYNAALVQRLEEHRPERDVDLSDDRFRSLQQLVSGSSDVLVIDGMLGGVIEGYEFCRELVPNDKPLRQQLPQMSMREVEKGQCHATISEQLGQFVSSDGRAKSG